MSGPRLQAPSGFSLAELLVALTVMAFVTALATQGLWTGVRVWERGRAHAGEGARLDLVRGYLRGLIEQAHPLRINSPKGLAVWFEGAPAELIFLAPGPRRLADEGMKRFRLHSAHEDGTGVLRLSWCAEWGEVPTDPCRDEEHHVDLLEHMEGVSFAYGADGTGTWVRRPVLPDHLTIEANGSGGRAWRPLTVALPIDRDVTCRFDTVTRNCRRGT